MTQRMGGTSSQRAQQPSVKKNSLVIPEASERDELTVQDMVETRDGIKYPLTSEEAISSHGDYLTDFEKTEVKEFDNIFYLSPQSAKYQPTN